MFPSDTLLLGLFESFYRVNLFMRKLVIHNVLTVVMKWLVCMSYTVLCCVISLVYNTRYVLSGH